METWLTMSVSLGLGGVAGFFMHRSDFCLTAAFRDLFLFRSWALMRPLILLAGASALLFELARLGGALPYHPFPLMGVPSWTTLLGGMLFGIGMVLAGGCVVGVLYKLGAGSLLAGVAVLGLIGGSALYAELHPVWIQLVAASRWSTEAVTLPQWLGFSPALVLLPAVATLLLCGRWLRQGRLQTLHAAEGYIPPWRTALVLAAVGLASAGLIGMPLGVTTSYAKLAALAENVLAPAHLAGTAYFAAQPITYVLPLEGLSLRGGPGPGWDVVAIIQYPLILGILLGSCLSAVSLREFHPCLTLPARQLATVFCGGVVMALGSRMAQGCNVWHLLGGVPILTLQGLLFLAGLIPGAWLGGRLLLAVMHPTRS